MALAQEKTQAYKIDSKDMEIYKLLNLNSNNFLKEVWIGARMIAQW